MLDPHNPFYTGTFWENIGPDGTATESRTSLAHGWASGPTPIMTSYVLGVQPASHATVRGGTERTFVLK